MFNAYVWQLYKESERGRRAIEHCSRFSSALHDSIYLMPNFGLSTDEMLNSPSDNPKQEIDDVELIQAVQDFAHKIQVESLQQANELFAKLISCGLPIHFTGDEEAISLTSEDIAANVQHISIGLHLAHPDYFIPYGFTTSFLDLQRIDELFNLTLPPIPSKKDIDGRGRYYAQLNSAFYEFRQSYSLSSAEVCAFLHDFALQSLLRNEDALPEPSKVWLISGGGGNNGDFEWLEDAVKVNPATYWQGNLETRRGDVARRDAYRALASDVLAQQVIIK